MSIDGFHVQLLRLQLSTSVVLTMKGAACMPLDRQSTSTERRSLHENIRSP